MGDRGNIYFHEEDPDKGFYFYAHWSGTQLPQIVADALKRGRGRWNDPPYLARIIFSEMIHQVVMETVSFGISTSIGDNEHPIVIVNAVNQTVTIGEQTFSFNDFINLSEEVLNKLSEGRVSPEEGEKIVRDYIEIIKSNLLT